MLWIVGQGLDLNNWCISCGVTILLYLLNLIENKDIKN